MGNVAVDQGRTCPAGQDRAAGDGLGRWLGMTHRSIRLASARTCGMATSRCATAPASHWANYLGEDVWGSG